MSMPKLSGNNFFDLSNRQFIQVFSQPYLILLQPLVYHSFSTENNLPASLLRNSTNIRPWRRMVTHLQHNAFVLLGEESLHHFLSADLFERLGYVIWYTTHDRSRTGQLLSFSTVSTWMRFVPKPLASKS